MSHTYPVSCGLRDILTNFLWRKSKGSDLGCKSRGGANLTTGGPQMTARSINVVQRTAVVVRILTSPSPHWDQISELEAEIYVSRHAEDAREDDTYAWRVRKVVNLS
jgi:hypothetical protein